MAIEYPTFQDENGVVRQRRFGIASQQVEIHTLVAALGSGQDRVTFDPPLRVIEVDDVSSGSRLDVQMREDSGLVQRTVAAGSRIEGDIIAVGSATDVDRAIGLR